jgi:hypothetical protein
LAAGDLAEVALAEQAVEIVADHNEPLDWLTRLRNSSSFGLVGQISVAARIFSAALSLSRASRWALASSMARSEASV